MSCQKPSIILSHQFNKDIWNSFDDIYLKAKFETSKNYEVKIIISLSDEFQLSSFSFGLTQNSQEGESVFANYKVPIKDANGNFTEKKQGDFYLYTLIIRNNKVFNSNGDYDFILQNTMHKYDVFGVHQLKLVITEL